jgi:1,4-dihydroxy-6-naphthoate synthase
MLIRLGHSPDPDDAFMHYALAESRIDLRGFRFEHVLEDIQTLNAWAREGRLEVTAISVHAYPFVQDRYVLLPHGASMGSGYGPIVVTRDEAGPDDLRARTIAVPGLLTTAFLTLRLALGDVPHVVLPFDEILPAVERGEVDAGLLIHEGQLTYAAHGLHKALDLGEWWASETGLPLPLGANAVRRDLGEPAIGELTEVLRESIAYALAHREEALAYAARFGRGLDDDLNDRFVGMYVNDLTQDYGEEGRAAVRELLRRGEAIGAFREVDGPVAVEFAGRP